MFESRELYVAQRLFEANGINLDQVMDNFL